MHFNRYSFNVRAGWWLMPSPPVMLYWRLHLYSSIWWVKTQTIQMNENHASEIKIRYIIYGLYYNVTIMSTFFYVIRLHFVGFAACFTLVRNRKMRNNFDDRTFSAVGLWLQNNLPPDLRRPDLSDCWFRQLLTVAEDVPIYIGSGTTAQCNCLFYCAG